VLRRLIASLLLVLPITPQVGSARDLPLIAVIEAGAASKPVRGMADFWTRLTALGWIEGKTAVFEKRYAEGDNDRFLPLTQELLRYNPDVVVTFTTPGALAAKRATSTVPIVVGTMGDPIGTGIVSSLARPGGNLTGLSQAWDEGIAGKWLELSQEITPHASTIGVIADSKNRLVQRAVDAMRTVAPGRKVRLVVFDVRNLESLQTAFATASQEVQAMVVIPDPFNVNSRRDVIALAAKYRIPTIYGLRDFADDGGLAAYAVDQSVIFSKAAEYVDKILRGARPGDMPIEQATRYSLVVNVSTAKAMGIKLPEAITQRADELIQ